MPVVDMNYHAMIAPLGIIRFFQIFLSCTAFSLVASVNAYNGSYGAWCMFTWIFCFIVTVFIVLLELIGVCHKLPISWEDFTSAFSMLATLMIFTTSIIYPSVYLKGGCSGHICACMGSATAMSILCFLAYAAEVGITRAKPGEISGFLSTIPGLLKVFEAYVACLIFSLLDNGHLYNADPGRQWCMAVYCICFIITTLIIFLTIGRLLASLPFPFEKFLIGYNVLAVLMYLSAAIVWPIFSFRNNNSRPTQCDSVPTCTWNSLLGATFLTYINLIAYIIDLVYSTKMVFFTTPA
ncbi:myeloid-associated differentiation marker homolog [Microcaecilia unicolor]|uniref:Myeloid-associated differentiation marker homolog n=1 Tax=Microcaecilia unicolor TaxID=1415580 RepID=A0A6P7YXC6_9AMPH|nr:myeloid-associated differentiation marker homolog [Microcaecilia unicolor]